MLDLGYFRLPKESRSIMVPDIQKYCLPSHREGGMSSRTAFPNYTTQNVFSSLEKLLQKMPDIFSEQ